MIETIIKYVADRIQHTLSFCLSLILIPIYLVLILFMRKPKINKETGTIIENSHSRMSQRIAGEFTNLKEKGNLFIQFSIIVSVIYWCWHFIKVYGIDKTIKLVENIKEIIEKLIK